jgi:hypothetical protein
LALKLRLIAAVEKGKKLLGGNGYTGKIDARIDKCTDISVVCE